MKIEMDLSSDIKEPYVVIHTNAITDDIKKLSAYIQSLEKVIAVYDEESIIILEPEEIYMIVSKGRSVDVFCKEKQYVSKKCLYEFEEMLRDHFMRISKTTIINLKQIDRVEPSFSGMLIVLKNGKKDYISRKYLPEFKKYLGL
ncbi:MAG: LytTR family transcriptional regulator [Lachnospiraceae bacterium]|nr:LytTR family transcriptional regulator [Lachnospiraceae bacterium]